ncbi:hypothetical protein [Bradyrhizobium elkanii]|jgi:hypothetical protein|uniref:hypothetical protein n=1 Tax=Bradyrhizobium elkanii TaxID=29448 RepID=UPI0020A18487|nr:hypothetical protein [Bradyrhizobium elkanii]MCP1975154.1 hypothetical protein [Bradyrhizobium elkanii]MCS3522271.1 hypothetical protein [Bradyrhizobium elkanii]MCS4069925.1 hypothetical protein [Bradyrhizobium elkanii]MCS4076556.1 hypothetical protein [Bradyrhizobium elkanii]MCS4112464.1 hypothetical protein [Bradyrhizobium elkanii]
MPAKGRATATNATAQGREDILNARAISTLGAGVVSAMSAVGAAVIKKNKPALGKNADWFWHMFAKCEARAARIAEQAARDPEACGDATFIEIYAAQLPKLMAAALESHEKALKAK